MDGARLCDTLENEFVLWLGEDKAPGAEFVTRKEPGTTAIPARTYEVAMTWSRRFGMFLPEVLDVPAFTGVRFHAGNSQEDTDGCVLTGSARIIRAGEPLPLRGSKVALQRLVRTLAGVMRHEKITLDVRNWAAV